MAPKEHGAWGQLVFPLVVALSIGQPGAVALGLCVAAACLFLAHEPILVLIGQRGTRAARESAVSAQRRLVLTVTSAVALGGLATIAASWAVRLAALGCIALAAVALLAFLLKGRERSISGEIWIAWTLPASGLPVALASNVDAHVAIAVWMSFALAYSAGVFGVRGLIRDHREGMPSAGWLGLGSVLLVTVAIIPQQAPAAIGALLFWSVVAACRIARPSLKSLKRIGWLLVAASVAQAAWLITAIRFAQRGF